MDPLGGQPHLRNKSVSKEELIIHILLRDVSEFQPHFTQKIQRDSPPLSRHLC